MATQEGGCCFESWMYPNRWQQMGGEKCDQDSSSCAASEWSLVKKLGQARANEVFLNHWSTWFTQEHVDRIKALSLDHVKIPMGFWIIEELVQHPAERYPQGGWLELKRGLRQLKSAGLNVQLSMYAMPGVSTANQNFAGNNTDQVHFYEDANYRRALTWAAILTAMSHLDPDFQRVLGILSVNEPERNTTKTPGLEQYYADFVTIIRVVEYALGISCDVDLQPALQRMSSSHNVIPALLAAIPLLPVYAAKANPPLDVKALTCFLIEQCHESSNNRTHSNQSLNSTQHLVSDPKLEITTHDTSTASSHVDVVNDPVIGISQGAYVRPFVHKPLSQGYISHRSRSYENVPSSRRSQQSSDRFCITTMALPKTWQWQNDSASMAPHVLGPRAYEDHLYFAYGGVAKNATYDSYLDTICAFDRVEVAKANGEVPYGMGEFSLATNFNATLDELRGWGDAQKFYQKKASFWTFWTFRIEDPIGPDAIKFAQQWSYFRGVDDGIIPAQPSHLFNTSICQGREKKLN
ncbi:family 5 glycoside hydrolase [Melampsora larici-populina 98AG31]|uniref:Family 5 glycoside hydrolase n=1 Tax=Melampsora larici-populina (strain 98AG31 / pathotype 3-4-7) TaxID=747676 RepID=F4R8G5_MELLP|nr:family 5 glycoside hydrolase [Melampsora larici-populina 98AG31]EGG11481.1 family 5 glycoside hydrolase [Melampsora larici-populina 98AG31]